MTDILIGKHYPLGATVYQDGVNFCVFTKNAESLELLFFDHADSIRPSRVIALDPTHHRTFYYWHVFVKGVQPNQLYGYRAYGPNDPSVGHRFDGSKLLLDPYGKSVVMGNYDRERATRFGVDNMAHAMKSAVIDTASYDWQGDKPLNLPYAKSFIYELHVAGFTKNPNSGLDSSLRGTYAGLRHKIPYLKSLGVTTVELMPIHAFDPYDAPHGPNYWGYAPINFFSPYGGYGTTQDGQGVVDEFRDMVKAFHQSGIEVVLDVVFNHSNEGNENGPTVSYRGLENRAYYILERDRARYANYTGCGNTFNANHSIGRRLILDSLRYWVSEMHVDGFRFDLASSLARDEWGTPLVSPPILWEIDSEPILAGAKIIAEAWDAGGLYQVGSFVGDRWSEWNGKFRDDVRRFMKGDVGTISPFATRITASPDLYNATRDPNRSINFITCHDGFTLNDLVSYNTKHNEANGEHNRDGHNDNASWNGGVEGPTDDPSINALRVRQIKNFLVALFTSQGTPMLSMGDEIRRTQHGNNNAYCQDNTMSWFDWQAVDQENDILSFTRGLITLTQHLEAFNETHFWTHATQTRLVWHGIEQHQPDWSEHSHTLAFTLDSLHERLYIAYNAYWEALDFELPKGEWRVIVDTAQPPPHDWHVPHNAPQVSEKYYRLESRSSVILIDKT